MNESITIPVGEAFVTIDAVDAPKLQPFRWHLHRSKRKDGVVIYAATNIPRRPGAKILMHRLIMDHPSSPIDHKNGDGLDNRRSNLRVCSNFQNGANRRKTSGYTSNFKGVCIHKASGKWQANITSHGKRMHVGFFVDEREAAIAYDAAAKRFFGEFAALNFPDGASMDSCTRSGLRRRTITVEIMKSETDPNWCGLNDDPTFIQCCCNCIYHMRVHFRCCTDPKPTAEQMIKAGGGCRCTVQKGWACVNVGQPGEKVHETRVYDNWPEHSCGCECYEPIDKKKQIDAEERHASKPLAEITT